ncbi:MAG TPA: hypothetical protein PKA95_00820, partial [Thermomicrobiales bacterium]|nr:hypothetical protein [Thermomicrobiales bacterium]
PILPSSSRRMAGPTPKRRPTKNRRINQRELCSGRRSCHCHPDPASTNLLAPATASRWRVNR